jgi:hypothetical protein
VIGLALVGSQARGTAGPESDVDLVVLTSDPHVQLGDRSWLSRFGDVRSVALERYGMVTSLRVAYASGAEVEFALAPQRWAWIDPIDPGTRRVVRDGMRVLYDPTEILTRLLVAAG